MRWAPLSRFTDGEKAYGAGDFLPQASHGRTRCELRMPRSLCGATAAWQYPQVSMTSHSHVPPPQAGGRPGASTPCPLLTASVLCPRGSPLRPGAVLRIRTRREGDRMNSTPVSPLSPFGWGFELGASSSLPPLSLEPPELLLPLPGLSGERIQAGGRGARHLRVPEPGGCSEKALESRQPRVLLQTPPDPSPSSPSPKSGWCLPRGVERL